MSASRIRYTRDTALGAAMQIFNAIKAFCPLIDQGTDTQCRALKICGSLRRRTADVGDIDIVYLSKIGEAAPPGELLPMPGQDLVAAEIRNLVSSGMLAYRKNRAGNTTDGQWIKFLVHVPTGIPVDFYRAQHKSFWNLVLCRTGSEGHNIRLAARAQSRGLKWTPTAKDPGFMDGWTPIQIMSEEHAYEILGLDFLQPYQRD